MTGDEAGTFLRRVHDGLRPIVRKSTVPIVFEQRGETVSAGSGFLLSIAEDSFLVTAGHVLDMYLSDGARLYIPDAPTSAMTLAGEFAITRDTDRLDAGVVRLVPENVAALQGLGYSFMRADRAREIDPRDPPWGGYALIGFPAELALQSPDGALAPDELYYGCTPWKGDRNELPSLKFSPETHLALNLHREVRETLTGRVGTLPKLQGMSGCSVWHAYAPEHATGEVEWSDASPRLVAFQSAVFPTLGVVKAVTWTVVKQLIVKMWPDLRPSLDLVPSNSAIVREVLESGLVKRR